MEQKDYFKNLADTQEIKNVLHLLKMKWGVQNDKQDIDTSFIYWCKKIDQVISLSLSYNIDIGYALHRWYNFQCSKCVEKIFCEYGAIPYEDPKDHDIDLIIDNVPFDIKLSFISNLYKGDKDLSKRANKDNYIKWLKENASQEGRKHTANKIFVICETLQDKCNFLRITEKVIKFIDYFYANAEKYKGQEICELIYIPKGETNGN